MPPQTTQTNNHKKIRTAISLLILLALIGGLFFYNTKNKAKPVTPPATLCSTYFKVCINNPTNQWKVATDTLQDFDLTNEADNIALFFVYSTDLSFKESGTSFTTVSLQGETKQVYKDNVNGLTRVMTGTKIKDTTLLILMTSDKDIDAIKVQEIIGNIKF